MAVSGRRSVLPRALPALLFLLLVLAAAPHPATAAPCPVAHPVVAAESTPDEDDPAAGSAPADRPADGTAVLSAQFTAGARGCRAPPVVAA